MVDEKDKKILEYLEEGLMQTEIAKKMLLTAETISRRIKKMRERGIEIPTKNKEEIDKKILEYLEEGLTQREIGEKVCLSNSTVYLRIKKMRERGIEIPTKNKEKIDRKILEYLREGLTQAEIGEKVCLSNSTVYLRIRKMKERGIEIPSKKKEDIDEADKEILKSLEEGLNQVEIGKKLYLTTAAISFRIKQMKERGIEIPQKKKKRLDEIDKKILQYAEEGLSKKEIAQKMNFVIGTILNRINKMREIGIEVTLQKKRELDQIDKKILEYLEEGLTQTEIAEKMCLTGGAISRRIKRMIDGGVESPKDKINKKISQYLEEGLNQTKIAEIIGLTPSAISIRIKRMNKKEMKISKIEKSKEIEEFNYQELSKAIMNLIKSRNATVEQIQTIANYYGVDLNEIFYSLDER